MVFQEPRRTEAPLFRAFADPDDHLRLIVLIANALDPGSEAGRACLDPKAKWGQRLDAIGEVLVGASRQPASSTLGVLTDFDALDPGHLGGGELWKDGQMRTQRADFLERLLDAVERGGWVLARPLPQARTSERLSSIELDVEPNAGDLVPPECAPMRRWLVERDRIGERELGRQIDAAGPQAGRDLLDLVYDALRPSARAAGRKLAALRPPMAVNGVAGPFPIGPDDIPREALSELTSAGVLQELGSGRLRMPRTARRCFLSHAKLAQDDLTSVHRELGARDLEGMELEEQLETHFHAIRGGSFEDARRTARYYGTDLRELGIRLSRAGEWRAAAEVFTTILEFDPDDAYAHEYWAYNRARELGRPAGEDVDAIRKAYERAHRLAGSNPLYHGRWLGFRAEHGEDVKAEIEEGLRRYLAPGAELAASYFAEPALRGVTRGRRRALRAALLERWGQRLRRAGVDPELLAE